MKRLTKIILVAGVLFVLFIGLGMLYFFKKNEAPILYGELEHNIEYKSGLTLDVYQPTQAIYEKAPVLVYIHGGAWITGSKISVNNARFNGAFNTLRDQGYAVISPDYTLAEYDKSPFPECLADAFDAMAWIENHAEEYNFDLNNVGILGESAGGHISMMLAYDPEQTFTKSNSIPIRYLVDVYGPTDLYQLYKEQIPLIDSINERIENLPQHLKDHLEITRYLFGFNPAEDTVKTKAFTDLYSPINFLNETIPNTLMIHGNKDRVVPISQSYRLEEELKKLNVPYEFHVLEGVDHAFREANEEQKAQTQTWISEFVLKHYQK